MFSKRGYITFNSEQQKQPTITACVEFFGYSTWEHDKAIDLRGRMGRALFE